MEQVQKMTAAQYEIVNLLSCINDHEYVAALKDVIVQFLNTRLQSEIERLWDNGTLTEAKVSTWKDEHMRTPYK